MATLQVPSVGRIVHYFAVANRPLAAIVTRVVNPADTDPGTPQLVDLTICNDDSDVDGAQPVMYRRRRVPAGVFYGAAGTWAWPPHVPAIQLPVAAAADSAR